MWETLFIAALNMSITASFVILAVLLVRLLLKKAPKIFSYALWAVVLFRLICPFSFESAIGLLPVNKTPIPFDIVYSPEPQIDTGLNSFDDVINPMLPVPANVGDSMNPLQLWAFAGAVIWVSGILSMLVYSMIQFVRLRRKLIGATPLRDHIYLADHISSPFVMGFIKPNIYLPSSMAEAEQVFIIAHEQYHIKRFDHIARILSFMALTVHWFNPLAWLAFVLSGKDMEMSCDEAVMKKMGTDIRLEYSRSLLRFATGRKLIAATPLTFGEGDTKDRVKNVMRYKKPILWMSAIALIAVVCVTVGLMSNSKSDPSSAQAIIDEEEVEESLSSSEHSNINENQGISDFKGVELYVWKDEMDETYFTLLSGTNRNKTEEEIYDKNAATTDISKIANTLLSFDDGLQLFLLQMNENDFTKDEMLAFEQNIISHIGDSIKDFNISTGFIKPASEKDFADDTQYKTESEFLNHPDGVKFQSTAYRAAKAYLSGNVDELLKYATENLTIDKTHDLFKDIDYMILKWSLSNIKAEDKMNAAYEFKLTGEDSASYVSMELVNIDGEWKVDTIGLEK